MKYKIEGMKELTKRLEKMEQVPQKCVQRASKKGANIALKQAKADAPEDTGMLKKGLRLVGERSRKKGRKIYQVAIDRAYNDIFQYKKRRQPKKGKVTGYYPASQEYGWTATNGKYTPGYNYMHKALPKKQAEIEQKIVKELMKELDKV